MTPALRKIEDLASDWVLRRESGLAPAEAREFERWKDSDPRHAEALARHERAWALLDRPRESGQATSLLLDLSRRFTRRRRRRVALAAAACVALLATGAFWKARHPADTAVPDASAIVLLPEKQTLPDGSVIELRVGAEVSVDYSGPLRRVALRKGEALFEVAKNRERPFVVTAGGIEVRAVGTAFVVQWEGNKMEVLVAEGRVRIDAPGQPAPGDPALFLDAGHRVTMEVGAGSPDPAAAAREAPMSAQEIAERLSWRAPRVEFSETPLGEAVSLMNRHSAVRLVIDDPALAAIHVNGLFRADDATAFVRLLEANFGVEARRSGDTITLRFIPRQ